MCLLPLNLLSTSFTLYISETRYRGSLWCFQGLCLVAFAKYLYSRVLALFAGHHCLFSLPGEFLRDKRDSSGSPFQLEEYVYVWLISHRNQQDDRLITDHSILADKYFDVLCMPQLLDNNGQEWLFSALQARFMPIFWLWAGSCLSLQ